MQTNELSITRPDDWHLHLRDDEALTVTVPATAAQFARAIVMPNLKPPVTSTDQARAYQDRIRAALPEGADFSPLMTLYLTDQLPAEEIGRAKQSGIVFGAKLYPAGATTNSSSGVSNIEHIYPVLEAMQDAGMVLQVHAEVTDPAVDIFDRERVFLERHLSAVVRDFPRLQVVLEHVTTAAGVEFVQSGRAGIAATVTVQHLMLNRNALFQGGLRPHHYCLPVLKRESDRRSILAAVVGGDERFFAGTDSAPHARRAKESDCGCAGVFSAPHALEHYATALEQAGALDRLEGFVAHFGADFYGLARNSGRIHMIRDSQSVPAALPYPGDEIVPFGAGGTVDWRITSS